MRLSYKTYFSKSGGYWQTLHPTSIPKKGEDPFYYIDFFWEGEHVAEIYICKTRWGFWETHSWLSNKFHGKGLGLQIYKRAIALARRKGFDIASSTNYSAMAERLWKSKRLRKKHKIVKKGKRYRVLAPSSSG